MTKPSVTIKALACLFFAWALCSTAQAQQRTFVSGTGNDANACTSVTAPCRTFQRGHNAVAAGGEVVALNSAGYGSLSITKSVTISGEGIRAVVTSVGAGDGVSITAPLATVILRELTIMGNNGTGDDGVLVNDAAAVYIERCAITNFAGDGIDYRTNNRLFVTDTVSRSNGVNGLLVNAASGGTARVNVDRSRFEGNGRHGIDFEEDSIEASITNSVMSDNDQHGLEIGTSGNTRAQVEHSTVANNLGNGFAVFGTGANELSVEYSVVRGQVFNGLIVTNSDIIRISNSVVTNNDIGFNNAGGTFESRGNNTVAGNTNPNVGVITPLPAQ